MLNKYSLQQLERVYYVCFNKEMDDKYYELMFIFD